MQSGIGRAGYRLLAFVFVMVGGVGLALLWYSLPMPWDSFMWLGLGLNATALTVLFGLGLWLSYAYRPSVPAGSAAPVAAPPAASAAPPAPAGRMDYEYPDAPVLDFADLQPPRAARAAPPAPAASKDPRAWPERPRRNASGQVVTATGRPAARAEMAERYTQNSPMVRGILQSAGVDAVHEEIPHVTAELPGRGTHPARVPDGFTRGKCGECGTVILAPTVRPIRLVCPRCRKTTLLRG